MKESGQEAPIDYADAPERKYQPAIAHKLLDRSLDRISRHAVLVGQLKLSR